MTPNLLVIRAGTNRPIRFRVDAARVPVGATFELVVSWSGTRRVYGEGSGLAKTQVSDRVEITWTYSLADSREFPIGVIADVEMQWTLNGVQDSDTGKLNVLPGNSND